MLLTSKSSLIAFVILSMMTSARVSSSKASFHIWQDDVLNILDHGLLVGPVLRGMSDVPIGRKLIAWMTAVGCSMVYHLDRKEISSERAAEHGCNEALVIDSYCFRPS